MFEAYFKALLERNRLITETMIRNQQVIAEMFSRNLDFGADFLHHQMRVFSIVTQWRDPGAPDSAPESTAEPVADEAAAPEPPPLKVVPGRR